MEMHWEKPLRQNSQAERRSFSQEHEEGNENLVKILKTHGARVDDIATYDTVYEKSRLINVGEEIRTGSIDCVVFTSASTVKGFVESTGLADYSGVAGSMYRQTDKSCG